MRRRDATLEFLMVALMAGCALWSLWSGSSFSIYQARDLDRAARMVAGSPVLFGPEVNGGGNLPGPFYYLLLAIPGWVGLSWQGAWVLMVSLTSASAGALWLYFRRHFNPLTAAVSVTLLLSSPPLLTVQRQFYNPAFLLLFLAGAIVMFARSLSRAGRPVHWYLACAVTGLAIQIHFSAILALVAAAILQLRAAKMSKRVLLAGLGIVFLVTLPYWLFLFGNSLGHVFAVPREEASGTFANAPFDLFDTGWLELQFRLREGRIPELLTRVLLLFNFPFALPVLGLMAFARIRGAKTPKRNEDRRIHLKFLLWVSLLSLPHALFYALFEGRARYALVFSVSWALFLAVQVSELSTAWAAAAAAGGAAIWMGIWVFGGMPALGVGPSIAFACIPLALLMLQLRPKSAVPLILASFLAPITVAPSFFAIAPQAAGFEEEIEIAQAVKEMTGWNYATARKHLFYLNFFNQHAPRIAWSGMKSGDLPIARTQAQTQAREIPDGVIVLKPLRGATQGLHSSQPLRIPDFKSVAARNELESSVLAAFERGSLEPLQPVRLSSGIRLFPYRVKDPNDVPLTIQNSGFPYEPIPRYALLTHGEIRSAQVERTDGRLLFRWNECPSQGKYCTTGFLVEAERGDFRKLRVEILGIPLSVPAVNTVPEWTEAIFEPFLEVECDGKKHSRVLAGSIGYFVRPEDSKTREYLANRSLMAPVEFAWKTPCVGRVRSLRAGWHRSRVTHYLRNLDRGEQSLSASDL